MSYFSINQESGSGVIDGYLVKLAQLFEEPGNEGAHPPEGSLPDLFSEDDIDGLFGGFQPPLFPTEPGEDIFPLGGAFEPPSSRANVESYLNLGYTLVANESFVETNLKYGHQYDLKIAVVSSNAIGVETNEIVLSPDCYLATSDWEFCKEQPIIFSSAPAHLKTANLSRDDTENVTAVVTWSRPVQHGGPILGYFVRVTFAGTDDLVPCSPGGYVDSTTAGSDDIPYVIRQLEVDHRYRVQVTPLVDVQRADTNTPYGNPAWVTFDTTGLPDPDFSPRGKVEEPRAGHVTSGQPITSTLPVNLLLMFTLSILMFI
ncbi:uncharacterized protein [Branchiostoma lanceolatum]|uniref:uncharacterized protein n=1 Tax=Branchiostoma lanceolatum TaxID=7740 RepID=UPI003452BAAD